MFNRISNYKERSKAIVSVFAKTITDLMAVNEQMTGHIDRNNVKISNLQSEQKEIQEQVNTNQKLIEKLDNFLND